MASHFISSSVELQTFFKLFANPSAGSQVVELLPKNSQITVLDEYAGRDCSFHYVSSSVNAGYVLNEYIYPLSGTAESAPYVCGAIPNSAYVEPDWFTLTEYDPYYNEATNEYSICIASDVLDPALADENDILRKGVKGLIRFYNKSGSYDDSIIDKYLNYYIFGKIKDSYVPFRPLMRVKYLVTIHAKYFDAIEDDRTTVAITPLDRDYSDVDFVLKIDLKELNQKLGSIGSLLRLYNVDLITSNSTLVLSTSTLFGGEQIKQNPGVDEMDFSRKAENVGDFQNRLENLLTRNGYDPNPSVTMIDNINVQFAINSECNILYDVAVEVNGQCFKLRRAIEPFLKSEPVSDPTTIAFIKQVHNINKIEKCKVPWYDFAEKYVYPPVDVQAPVIDDSEPAYVLAQKLIDQFLTFSSADSQKPVKTLADLAEEEVKRFEYDLNYSLLQFPLLRSIFVGNNLFEPSNWDKTWKKLERIVLNSPAINYDTWAVLKGGEYYELNPNSSPYVRPGVTDATVRTIDRQPSAVERTTFVLYDKSPTVTIDGIEYTVYFSSAQKQKAADKERNRNNVKDGVNKIWEFLHKTPICAIIDLIWGCLMALCRVLGIPVDAVVQVSVTKNFTYDQMINEIIPYLPAESQQFLYEQLLSELRNVNSDALLYLLKKNISTDEYTTLGLESSGATYEDIIKVVAEKMIITTVSE